MNNIQKKFKALSVKNAIDVFLIIYGGCKIEYYTTFSDIQKKLNINKNTLRRITNILVRSGIIISVKNSYASDKRERVYVVRDQEFAEQVLDMINPSFEGTKT